MSGKLFLGGAAAAGVAYYVYERQKGNTQPASWSSTKYNELKGDTIGSKIDDNVNSLKQTTNDGQKYLNQQVKPQLKESVDKSKSYFSQVMDEANRDIDGTKAKALDSANAVKQKGKGYFNQVMEEANRDVDGTATKVLDSAKAAKQKGQSYFSQVMDEANRDIDGSFKYPINNDPNKSVFLKAGDSYIDTVNQLAFAIHDGVYSLFGAAKDKKVEVDKKIDQSKNDASAWINNKTNEASKKADKGWFNFKENNSTDDAIATASKGFGESSSFWAQEEKEQNDRLKAAKDGVVDSVSKAGESTLATLGSAKDVVTSKSKEAVNQVGDAADKAKPWFGLKSVDQRDEEKLDKLIAEMSRGYGENATFFANETYDNLVNQPVLIEELRSKAKKNLDEARLNLDKHRSHWYSWASKKDKEAQEAANKQFETAVAFSDDVEKRLVEGNKVFKDWTDQAISGTKQGLNYANEKTQQGLTQAQNWIRGDGKK